MPAAGGRALWIWLYRAADQFGQLIEVVLAAGDYLSAYVLERTLPHLDAIAHLSDAEEPPSVGTGRRAPTAFGKLHQAVSLRGRHPAAGPRQPAACTAAGSPHSFGLTR
jgi:hypothetical protein